MQPVRYTWEGAVGEKGLFRDKSEKLWTRRVVKSTGGENMAGAIRRGEDEIMGDTILRAKDAYLVALSCPYRT